MTKRPQKWTSVKIQCLQYLKILSIVVFELQVIVKSISLIRTVKSALSSNSLDCLQSISLSFFDRNNSRMEHAGHEISTRTVRRIGTRRDGSTLAPVSFRLTTSYLERACWGLITCLTSREKVDCKQSSNWIECLHCQCGSEIQLCTPNLDNSFLDGRQKPSRIPSGDVKVVPMSCECSLTSMQDLCFIFSVLTVSANIKS